MSSAATTTASTTGFIAGVATTLVTIIAFKVLNRVTKQTKTTANKETTATVTTTQATTSTTTDNHAAATSEPEVSSAATPLSVTTSSATASSATSPTTGSSTPAEKAARSISQAKVKDLNKQKLKMVLCVRNDLQMGKGKIAAQCCHAAVGVVTELLPKEPELVHSWDYNGAMKIALKVNSEEELDALEAKADELGLPNYLVVDAGHTQIPENTKTVLSIGPAPANVLDKLTGHLKLM